MTDIPDTLVDTACAAYSDAIFDGSDRYADSQGMRAALTAVAPRLAADGLRLAEQAIEAEAADLRANYVTGNVPIEYINGMEDAAGAVRKALAAIEQALAAKEAAR